MFLGGAEHEASRIRGSAIKGALAFWWRALNFARFVKDASEDIGDALQEMRQRERELFGSSDGGQGKFLLRIRHGNLHILQKGQVLKTDASSRNGKEIGTGARYLGYGIINAFHIRANPSRNRAEKRAGELERSCLVAGQEFEIDIIMRPDASPQDISELVHALQAFGLLGGLGARVRRGWGSVALKKVGVAGIENEICQILKIPNDKGSYEEHIKDLLRVASRASLDGKNWRLTAFANESRVYLDKTEDENALKILDNVGEGFLKYRGWRNGDRNFTEDHDWFRVDNGEPNKAPKRTAFGLPHNYSRRLGISLPEVDKEELERRASPLFFHVHRFGNGKACAVTLFMPTKFTPTGEVAIVRDEGNNRKKTPVPYDFEGDGRPVIEAFLDNKKPDRTSPSGHNYHKARQIWP